jgi:hypothetical protein
MFAERIRLHSPNPSSADASHIPDDPFGQKKTTGEAFRWIKIPIFLCSDVKWMDDRYHGWPDQAG